MPEAGPDELEAILAWVFCTARTLSLPFHLKKYYCLMMSGMTPPIKIQLLVYSRNLAAPLNNIKIDKSA